MTVEPTYWDKPSYRIMAGQLEGLLGKEKQLQAIADAWENWNNVDFRTAEVHDNIHEWWPELAALLDALIEENNDGG